MATYQDSRYNIALPSGSGGALVHIKTLTASSSATLSFVDGSSDVVLDNTYRTYIFKFINIHAATDNVKLTFQGSIDAGSNYNVAMTTTVFYSYNDGTNTAVAYYSSEDQAQGTAFQNLLINSGNANDECVSGELWLFNPSSTTFVKHFLARGNAYQGTYSQETHVAGYFNNTNDIDAVQFKMSSGNMDAGTIKLYGIKDS